MVDIPNDTSTTATITVGGSTTNTLEASGDHDWFKITLTAGQEITVTLNGITLEDPYLRIYDAAGNLIEGLENDDINLGVNLDSRLSFSADYTGTYYIDVGSYEDVGVPGGTGDYQLSVESFEAPPIWNNDQVAEQLTTGYWGDGIHRFVLDSSRELTVNLTGLTVEGQNLARQALQTWSDITGITFVETSSTSAQIRFTDDDPEGGAFTESEYSGANITSSHVNVDVSWLSDDPDIGYGPDVGGYAFQAYIHEIGHALGLGHAGNYNTVAQYPYDALYENDAWNVSIMSYFSPVENTYFHDQGFTDPYVITPMVADILAMQQLYGLSSTTRSGDTTYGFNTNAGSLFDASVTTHVAFTIFDTGGTDTLDFSNYLSFQLINLNPETFSNIGGEKGNVSIARGTIIENAIGGDLADTIIGNSAANILTGNLGVDSLTGGAGSDTFRDTAAGLNGDTIVDFGIDDKIVVTDATLAGFTFNLTGNTLNYTGGSLVLSAAVSGTITASAASGGGVQLTIESSVTDDFLFVTSNTDHLDGGDGSDTYMISAASDHPVAEISDTGLIGIDEVRFAATGTAQTLILRAGDTGIERVVIGTGTGASAVTTGNLAHNVDARAVMNGLAMTGNNGANTIQGTAFADTILGLGGDDRLSGFAGNDVLTGGAGLDKMYGGTGNDTYVVTDATDYAYENVGEGTDSVQSSVTHTLRANIENLILTGGLSIGARGNELANVITGNSGSNKIAGMSGDDRLIGGAGNDQLDGGAGIDKMYGGTGNDRYIVTDATDYAYENANEGTDRVDSAITLTLRANIENLYLTGALSIHGRGNELNNIVVGSSGSNKLSGMDGDDRLYGYAGNDQLDGGAGYDLMYGGAGNDKYIVNDATDYANESASQGYDSVYSSISLTLRANLETLTLTGTASNYGYGNAEANVIIGNSGDNVLKGMDANDKLYGKDGSDIVNGGAGIDWLEGGTGQDQFYGGADSDRFVFREGDFGGATTATADIIRDFSQGEADKIRLDLVDADSGLGGHQGFAFIGTGAFTGTAGELRYEQTGGDTYISGDTNGDGVADFMIRLDGLHNLVTGDFIL